MQKIGNLTDTATNDGEFTDGNVAGGISPTILPAAWFNTIQRELVNVVEGAGLTIDPDNDAQLLSAISSITQGRLLDIKTFTASGNYVPTSGTKKIRVRVWGAGGGGRGTTTSGAGLGSGAGGAYVEGIYTFDLANIAIIVGTGGAGVAAGNAGDGGNGGDTTITSLGILAGGGKGGSSLYLESWLK